MKSGRAINALGTVQEGDLVLLQKRIVIREGGGRRRNNNAH